MAAHKSNLHTWDHLSGPHDDGGEGHNCGCQIDGNHRTAMCATQIAYHNEIDARWATSLPTNEDLR